MDGITLLQTLQVEGEVGLLNGNYDYTMTAKELVAALYKVNNIDTSKPINIIGLGGTEGLNSEITFMNGKLYEIVGNGKNIYTKEMSLNRRISFSQVAIMPEDERTQTYRFKKISATGSDKNTLEINHKGVFSELLKKIGREQSKLVYITAKTNYIKARAISPNLKNSANPPPKARGLLHMIKGGTFRDCNGCISTITPQTVKEHRFKTPHNLTMVGVITGNDMAENNALKGLHVHSKHGHILDLGTLRDVEVKVAPIERTLIRTSKKDSQNQPIWREALKAEKPDTSKQAPKKKASYWKTRVKQQPVSAGISKE